MSALANLPQNPASAVMARRTAHDACAQPSRRSVRLSITESQAAKIGLSARWQAAWDRKLRRDSQKAIVSHRLQDALNQLDAIAESEEWSQRKLAAKVGLPESTLRKIKSGRADSAIWLPRIQAAASKLTATQFPH